MPRKDLSISEKIAILELIKKQPSNTSQRRLAEITGVPKSTVARIVQQQHKIRHELLLYTKGERRLDQKRKRDGKDPDVEEALSQWFSIVTTQGIHVTGPVLKSKSEEFARMLGHNDFKATDGWLSRWKSRFGIKFKKLYGEKGNAEQWNSIKLPNLLKKFNVKGIYNNKKNNNNVMLGEQKDEDDTPGYEGGSNQEVTNSVDGLTCCLLEGVEDSRNKKLLEAMQYQLTPQLQVELQDKTNISAALGKPANTERSGKSPPNMASTSNSTLASKPFEVEDSSPPIKKAREICIDIDISEDESTIASKPPLRPAIPAEPPVLKSVTALVKSTPVQPSPVLQNPVLDIDAPQKQKRILFVPNHLQSVMSNLSSLWKAGRLCDAFIGNGTTNLKVHKMILGAVCPNVLGLFYNTPQHKLPKVTFPSSVSKEALLAFAEYMYNGALDLDPDLLTQMKVIAKQLDLKDFEQLCNNQLKTPEVQDIQPTILEPMLSEPCSSSGRLQQMSLENNQSSITDITSTPTKSYQKNLQTDNTLNAISSTANNSSDSFSNFPLEVREETNNSPMESGNINLVPSFVHNMCAVDKNSQLPVKTEEVDPDRQQYGRETLSSDINYYTPDSNSAENFTHISNIDSLQLFSSYMSASQHNISNTLQHNTLNNTLQHNTLNNTTQHNTLNNMLQHNTLNNTLQHNTLNNTTQHNTLNNTLQHNTLNNTTQHNTLNKPIHVWKQNSKDKRNLTKNANQYDPYPISLFTANWANVPLLTQEIKKEKNID